MGAAAMTLGPALAELWPYLTLFASAFVAATLFPASSEAVLVGLLATGHGDPWLLAFAATAGNTLGAVVNWLCGRLLAHWREKSWFPASGRHLERAERWFKRYGLPSLLLTWLPLVGDALTVVAGLLGVRLVWFVPLVALGKGARYLAVTAATLGRWGAG